MQRFTFWQKKIWQTEEEKNNNYDNLKKSYCQKIINFLPNFKKYKSFGKNNLTPRQPKICTHGILLRSRDILVRFELMLYTWRLQQKTILINIIYFVQVCCKCFILFFSRYILFPTQLLQLSLPIDHPVILAPSPTMSKVLRWGGHTNIIVIYSRDTHIGLTLKEIE